jgi:hypothetical protein
MEVVLKKLYNSSDNILDILKGVKKEVFNISIIIGLLLHVNVNLRSNI